MKVLSKVDSSYQTDLQKITYIHEIWDKYNRFIDDFDLSKRVNIYADFLVFDNECKTRKDEPEPHKKAKEKIFNLFKNDCRFVILTEVENRYKEGLKVFDKGQRDYSLDCFVIDKKSYHNMQDIIINHAHVQNQELVLPEQKELLNEVWLTKHKSFFAIELDGDHSDKKDHVRDEFFFETYCIPTVRYEVSELVSFYKKYRGKTANRKHILNYEKSAPDKPYLEDITIGDIIGDVKSQYYLRMT